MSNQSNHIKFDETLRILQDADQPLTAEAIYSLSDLGDDNLKELQANWGGIPADRRRTLMARLGETAETNFDMDFSAVARLALTDLDPTIREAAVEATWTDESPAMLRWLMTLASADLDENVRATATGALGRFILQGELGKFDADLTRQAQNLALRLYGDPAQTVDVHRRALEAISNSSREGVEDMIDASYKDSNSLVRASAVFAMGRSCDDKWSPIVVRELRNSRPEIRYEAARSAGELEIQEAIPHLGKLLGDADREILQTAVWALGEIGGKEAQRLLEDLVEHAEDADDDDLVEAIEEALGAASLTTGNLAF